MDVGLESLLTLSNGDKIEPPEFLRKSEKKLVVEQRSLSRKQKGSENRKKQRIKVVKVHRKIREQRGNFKHKTSRMLVSNYDFIAFENLHIQNMMQNHYLAKSIADASWSQLMFFTRYKAEDAGVGVEFVDARNTSQICSGCGQIVQKSLAVRTHNCPFCGLVMDRDLNASKNILTHPTDSGVEPVE